jgi:exopolysaccharide biosynthesis polyprenyl glycosylphosphotransferase
LQRDRTAVSFGLASEAAAALAEWVAAARPGEGESARGERGEVSGSENTVAASTVEALRPEGHILDFVPTTGHSTPRGWLMRRLLALADVTGLTVAFVLAVSLADAHPAAELASDPWRLVVFVLSLPLWVMLARVHGLYERDEDRSDHSTIDDFVGVFHVVTVGTWLALVVSLATGAAKLSLGRMVAFWALALVLVPLFRALMRSLGRRNAAYTQNVLIVGSGNVARLLAEKIVRHPEYGLKVTGFVDRDLGPQYGGPIELIGAPEDLPALIREHGIERVIVAFSTDSHEQLLDVVRSVQDMNVQIDIVPRLFEALGTNTQLHTIEGVQLVGLPGTRLSGSSRFLKRTLDVVGASAGLIILSPLLVATAIWIKIDSRGPILFRQVRMGEGEREFRILKFRTMTHDADDQKGDVAHLNMHRDDDPRMFKVPSDPRVTNAGALLRRWRIDELPQLFNVLRGEMSLVGPRPLILDEDRFVEKRARRRLDLRPGMTGLWQVLGASDIPFDEMTKLDYLYVTNWSLREDLRLILLTLPSLTRSRSAY